MQFSPAPPHSPFHPENPDGYARWRAWKLDAHPTDPAAIRVPVRDPRRLTGEERARLIDAARRTNMALYVVEKAGTFDRGAFHALARQLGLSRFDRNLCADEQAVSALEVREGGGAGEYIPYTDRRLGWHTDGYYNQGPRTIRAFILHCVRAAAEGGENELLDPEIAYIHLRDENPDFVHALMAPDAMHVPANVRDGRILRPEFTGPVLEVDPQTGGLLMRYTERSRFVHWRDDRTTRAAIGFLAELLRSELPYRFRHRLAPGEGLINNNVLHNRSAFRDPENGPGRLLWRARSYDRVAGTAWNRDRPWEAREHDHVMAE